VVVGFLADFALTEKLRLQPELQYSGQGNKDKDLRINYLQIPVVLKYNITKSGITDFSTFDFAVVAGVGANITDNFFVDLRYALGVSNVFDEDGSPFEVEGTSTNIQLSVGYRL